MPVHIRNGRSYGGIPNGTVKGTTPSTVPTTVKQLNQIGAVGDIAPVTIPSAVKFSNGNTLETMIGSVATIETSPAVASHAVGDFILWNGQLYEVTAPIDVGETLTVGTNITAKTVGEELTTLKNGLIVKEHKTGTASFNNTHYAEASIDATKNGYTPLGVIAFRGGANTIAYRISAITIIGNTVALTVVNNTGSAETSVQTVEIDVLYKKS